MTSWGLRTLGIDKLGTLVQAAPGTNQMDRIDFPANLSFMLPGHGQARGLDTRILYVHVDGPDDRGSSPLAFYGVPRVAGSLGMEFWQDSTLKFDFAGRTLTIFPDPHPPFSGKDAVDGSALRLPLEVDVKRWRYRVRMRLGSDLVPRGGGATPTADLIVDTGSTDLCLPHTLNNVLRQRAHVDPLRFLHGQTRITVAERVLLSSLWLNGGTWFEPDVEVLWGEEQRLLGMGLLRRYKVTLDQRNRQLLLERAPDYKQITGQIVGYTGLTLRGEPADRPDGYFLDSVGQGSPGEKAGLAPGDQIQAIDGRPLRSLTVWQAQRLLNGFAGTEARLKVIPAHVKKTTAPREALLKRTNPYAT